MVLRHLKSWIRDLGPNHWFVGPLGGNGSELKMPLALGDGRALTWAKFADEIATKVAEQTWPADEEECWFVEGNAGDTSRYPVKKLWKKGERNK